MVFLSLVVRLINIHSPLSENYGFRQAQTAITVWTMATEGITFLHYQTPVLGAPWQVPFEFPTYQAAAALLAKTGMDMDVACRLTALLFFYLSALVLYRLCLLLFASRPLSLWMLNFYLWCPFMILWSRACLIDYASVFFALAYLYFLLRWMRAPRHAGLWGLAVACGCLGYLTKITTMPALYPFLVCALWRQMRLGAEDASAGDTMGNRRLSPAFMTLGALALALPLAAGLGWVRYTDQIKGQSFYTDWLVSANMKAWNYGTLAQRFQLACWLKDGRRLVFQMVTPPVLAGVWLARRAPSEERVWFWAATAAVALPLLAFFNLYYVHDYYYIAVSPFVAIAGGYGLRALWQGMPGSVAWLHPAIALFTLFTVAWSTHTLLHVYTVHYDTYVCRVGSAIAAATPPDGCVVIDGYNWDSSLLYYARRKGLMIVPYKQNFVPDVRFGYTTFVCMNADHRLLSLWKYHKLLNKMENVEIYRVSEQPL